MKLEKLTPEGADHEARFSHIDLVLQPLDPLKTVGCPSGIIDQIDGWTTRRLR
ncbi:MAG: hypothetical protein ACKVLE_10320 [Fidelibacterota bacterium]